MGKDTLIFLPFPLVYIPIIAAVVQVNTSFYGPLLMGAGVGAVLYVVLALRVILGIEDTRELRGLVTSLVNATRYYIILTVLVSVWIALTWNNPRTPYEYALVAVCLAPFTTAIAVMLAKSKIEYIELHRIAREAKEKQKYRGAEEEKKENGNKKTGHNDSGYIT